MGEGELYMMFPWQSLSLLLRFFYHNRWLVLVLRGERVEREREERVEAEKEIEKISGEGIKCVFSWARTKRAVCLPFTYLYLCL